jgi:carboxypeptidase C (cathepsin A)
MKFPILLAAASLIASAAAPVPHHTKVHAKHPPRAEAAPTAAKAKPASEHEQDHFFHPTETRSTGTVIIGGQPIAYDAVAGTLVVHSKDWSDTDALDADTNSDKSGDDKKSGDTKTPKPEGSLTRKNYPT